MLVSIGSRRIPVVIGSGLTELHFKSGVHGKKEAGVYRFWTCHGEDQYGPWTLVGRARKSLSPGDRFARMSNARTKNNPPAHRHIYARMFRLANGTATCIKPSTEREVRRWIDSHAEDCAFLKAACVVRGKAYKRFPRVP
jgi:hypothetical protein